MHKWNPITREKLDNSFLDLIAKDFICYKSGFSNLCRAEDIGLEPYLECFDESSEECAFLLSFANVRFCDCPLRLYIAKKLKK